MGSTQFVITSVILLCHVALAIRGGSVIATATAERGPAGAGKNLTVICHPAVPSVALVERRLERMYS